ncbi:hypothetical protein BH11BAC7_BH11BAC7_02490 [soil metagenome]
MDKSFFFGNQVNIQCISGELDWLVRSIKNALQPTTPAFLLLAPVDPETAYGKLIIAHELTNTDRVLFNLAFGTVFAPEVIDALAQAALDPFWKNYTGGFYRKGSATFNPTVRSAVFLLAGKDIEMRSYYVSYFHARQRVFTTGLVKAEPQHANSSFLDYEIAFNDQFLSSVIHGEPPRLDGEQGFPARRSTATHNMGDVILGKKTLWEIAKFGKFTKHMKKLWAINKNRKVRNNFISIFSGDPGTGKSHTADAIGNEFGLPVYKINFAQMVSKYIGETEKNLEKVFDRFDRQPCILFFDEAEAIFSKRTEVTGSNDQHANNLQSYLLQKVEEFTGIIILATNVQNLSQYFDKAFQRRYRLIVTFTFPDFDERLSIWKNALFEPYNFEEGLTERLAKNYQLTGGSIYNIVSDAVIEALEKDTSTITFDLLDEAMKDEFKKTGRKYDVCTDEMVLQDPARRYGAGYEQRKSF